MNIGKYEIGPGLKIVVIAAILFAAYWFTPKSWYSKNASSDGKEVVELSSDEAEDVITIAVPTWPGYAGGQLYNEGFKANKESRFYKEYGILVEFKVIDNFDDSRNAWKSGDVDLLWATADAFPTEAEGLSTFNPQIFFQCDWSRGGDAVVVRKGIKTVADLKGKTIAVAPMTPSHTFLLNLFKAGEISIKDVTIKEVTSAIDAADLFKKGQVDAAVVWSPDDQDCVSKVAGSKVLVNTKTATNIIADVFVVKKDYLDKNSDKLVKLVEGWLKGNAEINGSADKKQQAVKILAEGYNMPEDFFKSTIDNARLCTFGDNQNFFNVTGKFNGVTGENLYNNMCTLYSNVGYIKKSVSWRTISNPDIINAIHLTGQDQAAENDFTFTAATEEMKTTEALSTKKVSISFGTGQWELDDNTKYIIDNEFVEIAKGFSNSRIRIEGNTDNTGSAKQNRDLSYKRAKAVADYLQTTYGFDPNRFVIIGNGPDKPVSDNSTEEGKKKNRRTDFEILPN
jgi:NitT/TauT family transport system substrate-binding protein